MNHGRKQSQTIYLGDVGATKVFFAKGRINPAAGNIEITETVEDIRWKHDRISSFGALMQFAAERYGFRPRDNLALGVAGEIDFSQQIVNHEPYPGGRLLIGEWAKQNKVHVVMGNDFECEALGYLEEPGKSALIIRPAAAWPTNVTVMGAGTGCGEAGLVWAGNHQWHCVKRGEGGHSPLPYHRSLAVFYKRLEGILSHEELNQLRIESLLSGSGLVLIEEALTGKKYGRREIHRKASKEAWEVFMFIHGLAAQGFVLSNLGNVGCRLVLSGGVLRRHLKKRPKHTETGWRHLIEGLESCPTKLDTLRHVGIYMMTDNRAGLFGAARLLARDMSVQP